MFSGWFTFELKKRENDLKMFLVSAEYFGHVNMVYHQKLRKILIAVDLEHVFIDPFHLLQKHNYLPYTIWWAMEGR